MLAHMMGKEGLNVPAHMMGEEGIKDERMKGGINLGTSGICPLPISVYTSTPIYALIPPFVPLPSLIPPSPTPTLTFPHLQPSRLSSLSPFPPSHLSP